MKIKKLSKREFARAIRTGRGSAFLHVRHYGDEGIESELLGACLNDLRYDTSVEDCRSAWLARIIDSSRKPAFYREQVANALKIPHKFKPSFVQLVNLATQFFERGFGEFKRTLVDFRSLDDQELLFDLTQCWIDVAGMSGFEIAARTLVESSAEKWYCEELWGYLVDCSYDEDDAKRMIESRAKNDEGFALFWSQNGKLFEESDDNSSSRTNEDPWTIPNLIEAINTGLPLNTYSRRLTALGRRATDQEAETILSLIEAERDIAKVTVMLKFFAYRACPRVSSQLLDQIFTRNSELRRALRNAFSEVTSPLVRDVALKALKRSGKEDIFTGMALLEKNFDVSDIDVMLETLKKFNTPDGRHRASSLAKAWCEHSSDARLTEVLIAVYSMTPCAYCRSTALKLLVERDQAPEEFLFESQWDANSDTRFFARSAFTESRMTRSSKLCKRIEASWKIQVVYNGTQIQNAATEAVLD